MRTYRNESISHCDASDTHLGTAWDDKDFTIHCRFVGDEEELQPRIASGKPEFRMTVPVPNLYDLLDTYPALFVKLSNTEWGEQFAIPGRENREIFSDGLR